MGFDGQSLVEEFPVEVLSCLLAHQDATTSVIYGWSTGMSHHLKDICYGIVGITVFLPFEVLDTHDYDHVTGDRKTPSGFLRQVR
jgi:hypothetical protein